MDKKIKSQGIIINEGLKNLSAKKPPKRNLFGEVTVTGSLLVTAAFEIGKGIVGFFTGVLIKKWWDKRQNKDQT